MADKLNYNQIIHNTLIICYDSEGFSLAAILRFSLPHRGSCNGESLMYNLASEFPLYVLSIPALASRRRREICHKSNHNTIKSVPRANGKLKCFHWFWNFIVGCQEIRFDGNKRRWVQKKVWKWKPRENKLIFERNVHAAQMNCADALLLWWINVFIANSIHMWNETRIPQSLNRFPLNRPSRIFFFFLLKSLWMLFWVCLWKELFRLQQKLLQMEYFKLFLKIMNVQDWTKLKYFKCSVM